MVPLAAQVIFAFPVTAAPAAPPIAPPVPTGPPPPGARINPVPLGSPPHYFLRLKRKYLLGD